MLCSKQLFPRLVLHRIQSMKNAFLMLSASIFAVFTTLTWFRLHFEKNVLWHPTFLTCLATSIVALFLSRQWLTSKQTGLSRILKSFVFILLLAILYFNLSIFIVPWLVRGNIPILLPHDIWTANIFFTKSLVSISIVYGLFTSTCFLLGSIIVKKLTKISPILSQIPTIPLALIFGIITLSLIIFLLRSTNILTQSVLLFLLVSLHLWQLPLLHQLWKKLQVPVSLNVSLSIYFRIIFSFLILLLVLNLSETVRPVPSGFDDSTLYYDHIRHITQQTVYPPIRLPIPYENIAAAISIATNESNQTFALALGAYSLFIATYFFWHLFRRFSDEQYSFFGAVAFLSFPMLSALAFFETKPDILMLACFIMAFYTLASYWELKKTPLLYLSLFLLGSAATFKLTALFFIPGWFIIALLVEKYLKYQKVISISKTALFSVFVVTTPLIPWILQGFLANQDSSPQNTLRFQIEDTLSTRGTDCHPTGSLEDYSRFDHFAQKSLRDIILFPWRFSMNTQVNTFATEIGFIFLAILPFGLLSLLRKKTPHKNSWFWFFGILISSSIIFWLMIGKQIAWYIVTVWPIFFLVVFFISEKFTNRPKTYYFIISLFTIALLGQFLMRLKFIGLDDQYDFFTQTHSTKEYLEPLQPSHAEAMSILNTHLQQKVYMTDSRFWYGIENNTERAFMDSHLDTFSCLINTYKETRTADILRSLGVQYIFFSKSLNFEAINNPHSSYSQKINTFTEFLAQNAKPIWGSPYHMIFELTPKKEHSLSW